MIDSAITAWIVSFLPNLAASFYKEGPRRPRMLSYPSDRLWREGCN